MTILPYILFGCGAGILAGLLGVGGGIIIVPGLVYLLALENIPPDLIMKMALATSLASIACTSLSSMNAHRKNDAVVWPVIWGISPAVLAGSFIGTWPAASMSSSFLKIFFIIFLYYISIQMFLNFKPKPSRGLPGQPLLSVVGGSIGFISSFVGIGGGAMSVPFLTFCNVEAHKAIGTSAAIGFPLALGGAIGYILNGLDQPGLPELSVGYVYLPALIGIAAASMLTAPLGAKVAHKLSVGTLKKVFAIFLFIVASKMLSGIF